MVKSVLSQEEMLDIDVPLSRVTLALRRGWEAFKHAGSELCRSKTAIVGALMLLVLLALCLLTPYIARYIPSSKTTASCSRPRVPSIILGRIAMAATFGHASSGGAGVC
jgi:hypothetical protein